MEQSASYFFFIRQTPKKATSSRATLEIGPRLQDNKTIDILYHGANNDERDLW